MIDTSDKEPSLHPAYARVGAVLKQKWRLDKLLGIGGMAAVYAATHRNGNRVAIKVLHPELSKNLDVKTRFLREGYLANAVDHPGAVRVIDDDMTEEGSVFLVMELLEGETLDRRWERKGKTLPVVEVLSIANELLDVLAAAHAKGLVHRDIKPENAFLTREGRVKILDFGIARLRELSAVNRSSTPTVNEGRVTPTTLGGGRVPAPAASARSLNGRGVATTQAGATMGTPAFMPPEQARGRWDEVDARSDVWAAGATMFALLAGRFVHEAGTLNEQLLAAMTVKAPSLSSVLPDVHPAVAEVIDRALSFRKEDRWADARAMQVAIRQAYKASREPDAAIPAAPRFSEVDPDETLVMASPPFSDEDPAMTAQALASSPSAAPEWLPHRRSPWVVGIAAVAVGIAATALTFSRLPAPLRAPITAAAVAPIQTSVELSAPPVTEAPLPPRPADELAVEDAPRPAMERPAAEVGTPAPPGTGVVQPAVVEPPAATHAEPTSRPESSASDHVRVTEASVPDHSRPEPSAHPAHRAAAPAVAPPAASAPAEADEGPPDPPAAPAAPPSDSLLDRRH